MKSNFTVSSTLRAGAEHGLEGHGTPLLLLAKFQGMALGDDLRKIVRKPIVSQSLKSNDFSGNLGESVVIGMDGEGGPDRILFAGMGNARSFDCATIREIMTLAVKRAVEQKCDRLSIPILPNRLTSTRLPLRGTVHIMKSVASSILEESPGDGVLNIEFVCTPQAKRHVQAGLDCRRKKDCHVC